MAVVIAVSASLTASAATATAAFKAGVSTVSVTATATATDISLSRNAVGGGSYAVYSNDKATNYGIDYAIQYKNKIYFNTATEIYSVNTDGTGLTKVADYTGNDGYIHYTRLKDNGKLEYTLLRSETKGEKTSEGYGRSSMDKYIGVKTVSIG